MAGVYLKFIFLIQKTVIFDKKRNYKILSKYTLKRTKLHRFKNFLVGACPRTDLAMRSMSRSDMQIPKFEKNLAPPPKSWRRPCLLTRFC